MVTLHLYDDYTTNLSIESLLDIDFLIAYELFSEPIELDHGGSPSLVAPKKYAWKSPEWVRTIEIYEYYRSGFWKLEPITMMQIHGLRKDNK